MCRFRATLPLKNALPTHTSNDALIPSLANSFLDSTEVNNSATCRVLRLRLELFCFTLFVALICFGLVWLVFLVFVIIAPLIDFYRFCTLYISPFLIFSHSRLLPCKIAPHSQLAQEAKAALVFP